MTENEPIQKLIDEINEYEKFITMVELNRRAKISELAQYLMSIEEIGKAHRLQQ